MKGAVDRKKIDNYRLEILRQRRRKCAKNFAARGSGRFGLGFDRLGMKWATSLRCLGFCGERANNAMIGDRDPRADRKCDDYAARGCSHERLNRRRLRTAQMFSSGSSKGVTGPELMVSGDAASDSGGDVDLAPKSGCLIRVAINIAENNIAAAR